MSAAVESRAASAPVDAPPTLKLVNHRVEVSLRLAGRLVGLASARAGDVMRSTLQATAAAAKDVRVRGRGVTVAELADVRIGIAIHGRPQRFEFLYGVPTRQVPESIVNFKKYVEIGVYGFGGIYKNRRVQFTAGTPITYGDPDALNTMLELYRHLGVAANPRKELTKVFDVLRQITFYRFRCVEFIEHPTDRSFVGLYRGVKPFSLRDVIYLGREGMEAICRKGADAMVARQLPDGSFRYMYYPAQDRWARSNNTVRQAGAAWAMAIFAKKLGERRYLDAAVRSIKRMQRSVLYLDSEKTRACIVEAGGEAKLGTVALTLCAILDLPHAEQARFRRFRNAMVNAVLAQQKPDGSFWTYFRPNRKPGSQDYAPGEALLALIKCFQVTGDRRCLESVQTALKFYRPYFRKQPNLSFVTWQAQVYAKMYDEAVRAKMPQADKYAQFVFEMCDWLLQFQLRESKAGWPDCFGGFVVAPFKRPGIGTAAYLEGLAEGLRLARLIDPDDRAKEYGPAVLFAMRLVGQLHCRPCDTYYMTKPELMRGSFRFSLLNHSARIDNIQHAAVGLLAAIEQTLKPATRPANGD